MIQPKVAAAIASMKMTSDEKVAGNVPSAIASSPCPATCDTRASATSAATPPIDRGSMTGSSAMATTNRQAAVIAVE